MRNYSIEDLLKGQYYAPASLARKFQGGEIIDAEKRDDVWAGENYQAFAIRYRVGQSLKTNWATIAVKVSDL